jgi:hypothetical protein
MASLDEGQRATADPAKNAMKPKGHHMKKSKINKMIKNGQHMWGNFDMPQIIMCGPGCDYIGNDGMRHTTMAIPYKPEEYEIKSKYSHPYSYSPIIIFGDESVKADDAIYSDRMFQWDFEKTEKLLMKHFGERSQHFNDKDPAMIEKFLQERFNYPNLKLHMIVEWCNVSNGYPLWSFHYSRNA